MENNQQKMSKQEIRGLITIGCIALGAVAVTAAISAPAAVAATTVLLVPQGSKDNNIYVGPRGGLWRNVNGKKVYDVASEAGKYFK